MDQYNGALAKIASILRPFLHLAEALDTAYHHRPAGSPDPRPDPYSPISDMCESAKSFFDRHPHLLKGK